MRPFALLCVLLVLSVVQPCAVEAQEWNFHIVDDVSTAGYQSQVAVTSDGTPYILYKRGLENKIYLAWWVPTGGNGGGWDKLDLGTSHRSYACEIVVDSNDYLHMAWDNTISSIRYGVYDPATQTWVIPQEEAASQYGSLDLAAVEHNDTITAYIVYIYRYAPYHLKLCTRDPVSGSWSVETLHDESCSGVPSIAADSQGRLHVSFRETYSGSLMYATNANELTAWVSEYVDLGGNLGEYSSIVINESDVPYIVYYDADNGDLKYARSISE